MQPYFSVIIPVYGVEKYIRSCIDSVLKQSFDDFELILVDDGSPDNCPEICDEYVQRDSRVKVIHKKNGGLVSARKAGCRVASGKYIVSVDGDDWVKECYLNDISQIAKQHEPDVICFGIIHHWADRQQEMPYQYASKIYSKSDIENEIFPVLFMSEMGVYFPPSICTKAVKRELYVECQNNVDDRIAIGEDVACTRQIVYKAESMYIMKDCLYFYRQNELSMTKNKKAFSMLAPEFISEIFVELVEDRPKMKPQVYRCIFQMFFGAVLTQFNRKEGYGKIVSDIKAELEKEYIQTAIRNCWYSTRYYKGQIALFCLRYKFFFVMKLMNSIKNLI